MFRTWATRSAVTAAALLTMTGLAVTPAHAATTTTLPKVTAATPWPSALATATGMAAKLCGDARKWIQIRDANGLRAPYWLVAGRSYVVPCATAGGNAPAPARTTSGGTGWVSPLPGARCISGWGAPRVGHTHKGIDLVRPSGTPIRAAHAGAVMLIRYQASGAGWYVMLNHGTYQSVYMHLIRRSFLPVGAHVAAGQTIGYVGATGDAHGPHLHFEVHHGAWHPFNPAPFLRAHGVAVIGC